MKRLFLSGLLTALVVAATTAAFAAPRPRTWTPPSTPARAASAQTAVDGDADLPGSITGDLDKGAYLQMRSNFLGLRYGDAPLDELMQARLDGLKLMQKQVGGQMPFAAAGFWTEIGPYPIPNGQTVTVSSPVSGRVTSIVVHPTDPNIVYVGTAQGGVWRTLNGGASWVAIFDQAASLAIGALALAPSNPSILYVGTGECNLSADSFFGVGLYRVDNADTAPVLNGPFNPTPTTDVIGTKTFTGRSISKILVDASDPATIFVSTGSGIGGLGAEAFGSSPPITALRGIYRSTTGTSASPSFSKLTVTTAGSIAPDVSGNLIVNDMTYDPTDATGNTIVCWAFGSTTVGNGGIYRTTNAKAGTPTFAQTFVTTVSNSRGAFTANLVGATTTILVATGETATGTLCTTGSGCIRRSLDGGVTWSAKLTGGGGFCGGQCFYDLPIAVSPTDASMILIGGSGNNTCSRVYARSVDGGATFTAGGVADVGLHADAHAITFAPSNPQVVYEGSDGGIFKSTNGGVTWTSLNISPFSATQFQSIDVHPTDPKFSIGGTQDNGTNMYQPAGTWNHIDFGDGGFAVIDQNAPDVSNVTMYHTYFNRQNSLVAFARVIGTANAFDGNWTLLGQNANGISTTENPNFYAPLVRGPGNPNTIYYATDRLHRSVDQGDNNPVVSQAFGVPISAVAIAQSNDNVRLVGLNNSQIWGTVTGSSVLVNMTGAGMPVKYIGRIAIDPTNANNAYVCFGGFNIPAGQHVWKTTNLLSGTPTWAASGSGLPDVPANSFAIDPIQPTRLFVGTDLGVWTSTDGGGTWSAFTTGMPVVTVFDMAIQPTSRTLRVATHGRGMFERLLDAPVATQLALVGAEIVAGHPRLTWYSADGARETMRLYRRAVPGTLDFVSEIQADGSGQITYEDASAVAGRSYEYAIGIRSNSGERILGNVWVDVPLTSSFAVRVASLPQGQGALHFTVSLPTSAPARLDLLDITGRRVAGQDLVLGAGDHDVQLDAATKSGMYWARLSQAGKMVTARVALVR